jgi:hypothetical protein
MKYMKKNLKRGILEEIDSGNRILIKEKTGEKPEGMIREEIRLGGVLK